MKKEQTYTVIAVSKNTNSFGLKSLLLLSSSGSGWSILKSAYSGDKLPEEGADVALSQLGCYECPHALPEIDSKTASKIIRTVKKKALAAS
jgi:hypothetical protein